MLPMARYRCTANGANHNRTCRAGQMPNPPTPVSAICGQVLAVNPGDWVYQWEDGQEGFDNDPTVYPISAAAFQADFDLILL